VPLPAEGGWAADTGFARGSRTSLAHARSQAANNNRAMDSDFINRTPQQGYVFLSSHQPSQRDLYCFCRVVDLFYGGF
jgi:hypothetical protein